MSAPTPAAKRMLSELPMLLKEKPEYAVFLRDESIMKLSAYITAPDNSVYKHKVLKFNIWIPQEYPNVHPKVLFDQYDHYLIHPNFLPDGVMCLDILGGKWSPDLNIHTLLVSIRYHLDNDPWQHLRLDDAQWQIAYNKFVQYQTWDTLLIRYLEEEKNESAICFLTNFIRERAARMMEDFFAERDMNKRIDFIWIPPYRCYVRVNYETMLQYLRSAIEYSILYLHN
ncbi:UBC-like protein [Nemania sp. FL0031]|nr:UBC-like protein [Nemania sp. FL0031]